MKSQALRKLLSSCIDDILAKRRGVILNYHISKTVNYWAVRNQDVTRECKQADDYNASAPVTGGDSRRPGDRATTAVSVPGTQR